MKNALNICGRFSTESAKKSENFFLLYCREFNSEDPWKILFLPVTARFYRLFGVFLNPCRKKAKKMRIFYFCVTHTDFSDLRNRKIFTYSESHISWIWFLAISPIYLASMHRWLYMTSMGGIFEKFDFHRFCRFFFGIIGREFRKSEDIHAVGRAKLINACQSQNRLQCKEKIKKIIFYENPRFSKLYSIVINQTPAASGSVLVLVTFNVGQFKMWVNINCD